MSSNAEPTAARRPRFAFGGTRPGRAAGVTITGGAGHVKLGPGLEG